MFTKTQFYKSTRIAIREGLAITNDSVLTKWFLIASSDCTYYD